MRPLAIGDQSRRPTKTIAVNPLVLENGDIFPTRWDHHNKTFLFTVLGMDLTKSSAETVSQKKRRNRFAKLKYK